jgi:hypothetical protein
MNGSSIANRLKTAPYQMTSPEDSSTNLNDDGYGQTPDSLTAHYTIHPTASRQASSTAHASVAATYANFFVIGLSYRC